MTFGEAVEGIPSTVLARAFRVSVQTVKQYRMDPATGGNRAPPKGWEHTVARILQTRGDEYHERSAQLMSDALDP